MFTHQDRDHHDQSRLQLLICLEASEEARLLERSLCFILDANNGRGQGVEGRCLFKGRLPPHFTTDQEARGFICRRRRLRVETTQSALSHLEIGHAVGLTSIILIVFSTVSFQFQSWFVLISLGPILRIWQLKSWLQSGHHAVNFFCPVWVLVSTRQLTGCGSEY